MPHVQYFGTHVLDQICPVWGGQVDSGAQDAVTVGNDGPGTSLLGMKRTPGAIPGVLSVSEPI
jgi:hypothetical protein